MNKVTIQTTIRSGLPVKATGTYIPIGHDTSTDPGWPETIEDLEICFLSGSLYKKPLTILDEVRVVDELIAEYNRKGEE